MQTSGNQPHQSGLNVRQSLGLICCYMAAVIALACNHLSTPLGVISLGCILCIIQRLPHMHKREWVFYLAPLVIIHLHDQPRYEVSFAGNGLPVIWLFLTLLSTTFFSSLLLQKNHRSLNRILLISPLILTFVIMWCDLRSGFPSYFQICLGCFCYAIQIGLVSIIAVSSASMPWLRHGARIIGWTALLSLSAYLAALGPLWPCLLISSLLIVNGILSSFLPGPQVEA